MRKLNNNGFTLIELLAVIVILALIMVVAIPQVLSAMNSSRASALHSKAKSMVSWYSDTILSEQLMSDNSKVTIKSSARDIIARTSWTCIQKVTNSGGTDFYALAELDANSIELDSTKTPPENLSVSNTTVSDSGYCSAIRTNSNGKVEIFLVAKKDGRFHVPGTDITYAYTAAENGATYTSN